MSESNTTLVGNLTSEPELRYSGSGRAQLTFGIAVNRKWTNTSTGEKQEHTSFFNAVAWGTLAENCAASLVKGSRVIVTGRLEQRNYETKDGEKRTVVEVIADAIGPDLRFAQVQVEKVQRDKPPARPSDPIFGDESEF